MGLKVLNSTFGSTQQRRAPEGTFCTMVHKVGW